MSAGVWGALVGAGLGTGLVCTLAAVRAARPDLARRVAQGAPDAGRPDRGTGVLALLVGWALGAVETIGSTTATVERRLQLLGRPHALHTFRLQQFVAALLGMVATGALGALIATSAGAGLVLAVPLVVLGALLGAASWDQVLGVRARARQSTIDAQVPDASELLALAIGAGESIPGALDRVARVSSSELAGELSATGAEIRMGRPTTRALTDLAARNDSPSLDRLCQTLVTSIERGSPLAGVLHDQARDIRESSRQRLMEEGGRREIAMLLPVVFLILPITVVFAMYPGLMALEIGP